MTPEYLVDVKDDWLANQPYLHITSSNDEKYLCTLPAIPTQVRLSFMFFIYFLSVVNFLNRS